MLSSSASPSDTHHVAIALEPQNTVEDNAYNVSNDNVQMINNDDWDATCSIYVDLHKQEYLTNASNKESWQTWIDIPLHASKITFLRTLAAPNVYRVWNLTPNESTITFRCTFEYSNSNLQQQQQQQQQHEDYDNGDALGLLPTAVHVTHVGQTYPHSLPAVDKWQAWLQEQVTTVLRQDVMSYAVCAWLEHAAWDYFHQAYSDGEYTLLTLDDRGPTHYNVPTLVLTFPGPKLVWHTTNNRTTRVSADTLLQHEASPLPHTIHPIVLDRDVWQPSTCPICLEPFLKAKMERITCGHYVCRDCLTMYFCTKVQDIYTHRRDNPFRCPIPNCRQGLTIQTCVKQYLTPADMERVRTWIKDMKHPVCHALPHCLACKRQDVMRRQAIDSNVVYCDACHKQWCEWCLKRIPRDARHADDDCDASTVIRFCERYLAARPAAKRRCEERYPFMRTYAQSRMDRDGAAAWLKLNGGQSCPVCRTGVEREAGCFHMHCVCGAHFCYECGDELFYPFYGTHHCWEERKTGKDNGGFFG